MSFLKFSRFTTYMYFEILYPPQFILNHFRILSIIPLLGLMDPPHYVCPICEVRVNSCIYKWKNLPQFFLLPSALGAKKAQNNLPVTDLLSHYSFAQ